MSSSLACIFLVAIGAYGELLAPTEHFLDAARRMGKEDGSKYTSCCTDWNHATCLACHFGRSVEAWCGNSSGFLGCPDAGDKAVNTTTARDHILDVVRRLGNDDSDDTACCVDLMQACCVACALGYSYDTWCYHSPNFLGCPNNPNKDGKGPVCSQHPTKSPTWQPTITPTANPTVAPTIVPTESPTDCNHSGDTIYEVLEIVTESARRLDVTDKNLTDLITIVDEIRTDVGEFKSILAGIAQDIADVKTYAANLPTMKSDIASVKSYSANIQSYTSNIQSYTSKLPTMQSDITSVKSYSANIQSYTSTMKSRVDSYYTRDFTHPFSSSSIIGDRPDLGKWLAERLPTSGLSLCWRGSAHGFAASTFHSYCNGRGATVTIVQDIWGYVFGGFTTVSWSSRNGYASDRNAFLYQLIGSEYSNWQWPQISPVRYSSSYYQYAIYDHSSYGPTFGNNHDLRVNSNCNTNWSNYGDPGAAYLDFSNGFMGARRDDDQFMCRDVEVYRVY